MALWFETAVRYDKMQNNGTIKKTTEKFLVDALSFTEAEARIIEERTSLLSGEFDVRAAKKTKIAEIMGDRECGRFWLVKVAFITLDDKTGTEKKSVSQILVGASDFTNAVEAFIDGMKGTMADFEIISLSESPILEVYNAKLSASTDEN